MPVFDLYSKRQKRLRGELPDVSQHDTFPTALPVQIMQIWSDEFGDPGYEERSYEANRFIVKLLCREYGVFSLPGMPRVESESDEDHLRRVLLGYANTEQKIDLIEVTFRYIELLGSGTAEAAIHELNHRLKEHGVGYQYVSEQIIRVDSEFTHAEIVELTLRLLRQPQYAGAQEECLRAHEHYRKGNAKEAVTECAKSLESLLKSICEKRQWNYNHTATARTLIDTLFDQELIPSFWESYFDSLRSLLASGVPTARNKIAAHGQGSTPTYVPDYLVAHILHMTASTIVFLAEADAAFQ